MKVSRIEIKDFQQFKDFTLDLTYPQGHKLAGEPLKKVCIIGQSGTGKTTILNIAKEFLEFLNTLLKSEKYKEQRNLQMNSDNIRNNNLMPIYNIDIDYYSGKEKINKNLTTLSFNNYKSNIYCDKYIGLDSLYKLLGSRDNSIYIYFNAELLDKNNDFIAKSNINPNLYISEDHESKQQLAKEISMLSSKRFYDFSIDSPIDIWKMILYQAKDYMIEELKYTHKLSKLMVNNLEEAQKYFEEVKTWRQSVVNPFQELAKKANEFLHHFNLELKVNMDFENQEEMKFVLVQPRNKHTEKLDYQTWSTGTKQVVMTATPLFALDTKDTIILFDEPERSLYPDIQRTLIKYYTDLAPEAQFFFATHSPLIASQFEPWEIVELEFNEETGSVQRKKYYEGENHVDNYTIYPQYLRWDSILRLMFDVDEEGDTERYKQLNDLARLEVEFRKLKERKASKEEILAKWKEYKGIADKLDWHINNEKN